MTYRKLQINVSKFYLKRHYDTIMILILGVKCNYYRNWHNVKQMSIYRLSNGRFFPPKINRSDKSIFCHTSL